MGREIESRQAFRRFAFMPGAGHYNITLHIMSVALEPQARCMHLLKPSFILIKVLILFYLEQN
jgi:hypothetical protein